jgi:hypothetical protein
MDFRHLTSVIRDASQSERRGPRQITEWQVVRLHRLAPPDELMEQNMTPLKRGVRPDPARKAWIGRARDF